MNKLAAAFVVTIVIGFIVVIVVYKIMYTSKSSKVRNRILFVGPCGGGKTFLVHRLCNNVTADTIMSMKPCTLPFKGSSKVSFVDFPGHRRCRAQLSNYLAQAIKLVFVIDASNVQSQLRDTAEFLYDLFTDPLIDKCSKLYIFCNKSDLPSSRPPARIKLLLQQELDKIKTTRKSLEDSDDKNFVTLGREGQNFRIDQDSPIDVVFCAGSARTDSLETLLSLIEM
jgi:signal recognition particle receptor subunit beta